MILHEHFAAGPDSLTPRPNKSRRPRPTPTVGHDAPPPPEGPPSGPGTAAGAAIGRWLKARGEVDRLSLRSRPGRTPGPRLDAALDAEAAAEDLAVEAIRAAAPAGGSLDDYHGLFFEGTFYIAMFDDADRPGRAEFPEHHDRVECRIIAIPHGRLAGI